MRAAHLILGYEPLSHAFLDVGQSIRAGSLRLSRINVSKPGVLARRDPPPVVLPVLQNPQPAAQPPPQDNPGAASFVEEETESSRLSLEEEIDEFYFEEDIPKAPLIELSDVEGEPDRNSVIGAPLLVIACLDDSSDEEVDNMALNKGNKSLRELMAARGKGQTSKMPIKSQTPYDLPLAPLQIPAALSLKVNPDLKKKRQVKSLKEGEVGSSPGHKTTKSDSRASGQKGSIYGEPRLAGAG